MALASNDSATSRLASLPIEFERRLGVLRSSLIGELHFDRLNRNLYATDASVYQQFPLAVAIPQTESDIKALILFARENQLGLIPRTAGTSLAGQVVGGGIVVDVSKHFTKILEINTQEKFVRVQPGVIRNELNMALAPHGLMFGPETSTANRAMIGGMVGNNSCGSNSIVYGSTRDHLLEVRGFLSDGSMATFHSLDLQQFSRKCDSNDGSLETEIYRTTKRILDDDATRQQIHEHFPKPEIHRRNTGYAVDLLAAMEPFEGAAEKPFNFCKLIAGSEGTLFFTTEIKLNCAPLPPPESRLLCAHFRSVAEALQATRIAMTFRPYSCELMDRWVLEGASRNLEQKKNAEFVSGDPGAILMIEVRGQTQHEVLGLIKQIERQLVGAGLGFSFPVLQGDQASQVWELRKAGLGIISNIPGDTKPVAVIEDTAVALEDLPDFIEELNHHLDQKFGMRCVYHAHAGAGELHVRPQINLKTSQGNQQFHDIASDVADLVKKYKGSLSGEHGDGRLRAEFLERMVGTENYQLLKQIKNLWDPRGVFNPNKIIDAPPMNQSLRFEPDLETKEVSTIFDFQEEQGILRAAELCSGSGDCRKTSLSGGTMCPSYMATRNESETTRARANMLRHALTHPVDAQNPLNNEDLKQVMDLCLSCKGCKNECPSNVDLSKLKAEFLQGYYDSNGVPWRVRAIASFSRLMSIASLAPSVFNWLASSKLTAGLLKKIAGFTPLRTLPKVHSITLRKWHANHIPHSNAGQLGTVHLFCDEFTNFNDVPIGIAAIELLEAIGFQVLIPDHLESGRTALSKGMLRAARKIANSNVQKLHHQIDSSRPLVGIEPSAILSFRDEYPVLVSPELRENARQLAKNTLLFDEFISRLIDSEAIDSKLFSSEKRTIRLHGHCHQKALVGLRDSVRMLQLPKNYQVKLIPSGCCGMAGSFGYEKEHYELSMQIGELVLFPAVRKELDEVIIAASGTSCRHQITDGTGKTALHPIQILRNALR